MDNILKPSVNPKQSRASISLSLDWDSIFNQDDAETRRDLLGYIIHDRSKVDFCTGSSYTGKWNKLGFDIYGTYTFPYGCQYDGDFKDGRFHGVGTITYPRGQKLECLWHKGKMVSYKFCNLDGLDHNQDWGYCKMPDRRYAISLREGLQPANHERVTNKQPTGDLNPNCYDIVDGIFNPSTKSIIPAPAPVYKSEEDLIDSSEREEEKEEECFWVNALRIVPVHREKWIIKHCRKGGDDAVGYRPDVYESWLTGRKEEIKKLEAQLSIMQEKDKPVENEIDKIFVTESMLSKSSFQYGGTGRKLVAHVV